MIMLPKAGKGLSIPDNLRPIILLPTLSKIVEKLILKNLKHEVFEKHVIPGFQFEFKNSHSTSLQLARLIDLIVTGFNTKRSTVVFLDTEKTLTRHGSMD